MSLPRRPAPQALRLVPETFSLGQSHPAIPADAVFLSGNDPAAWIEEVCAWNLGAAEIDLRFHFLPQGTGVLITLPGGCAVPTTARVQSYRVLAGRLYLPQASRLDPPVDDEEIVRLCRREVTLVFHPGVGLCAFDAADSRSLSGMLAAPARASETWNAAQSALPTNDRLRSVRLETPADLHSLFGEAAQDIGSEPVGPSNPPPVAGESDLGATTAGRRLRAALARLALGLTKRAPRTALVPTWVNCLEGWAQGHLARLGGELGRARHRQLHRLLDELEQNPDQGLRHAIPLANLSRHRGQAPPSDQLGDRDPNFRLGDLAGGRAADAWQVPPDLHGRLRERYRQLANEETRLGRHRRAAYIHAELLGELLTAAACLKQGRHFHEAATLYRDHLQRPVEAADCFAAGGELAEALSLYEVEGHFLRAAELALALGDPARATAAYRREVACLVAAEDLVAAADLLADKLAAPREATDLLRGGWPDSKQAALCLECAFALLGRDGRHPEAAGWLAELAAEAPPAGQAAALARQMAAVGVSYPDETVRHRACDLVRVTVAVRLPTADSTEIRTLLDVLGCTAPGDRLLTRDGNRYLAARQQEERRRAAAREKLPGHLSLPAPTRRQARRVGGFRLPTGVRWQQVRGTREGFYAAGYTREYEMVLARARWDGFQQTIRWGPFGSTGICSGRRPLLLELPPEGAGLVLCACAGATGHPAPLFPSRRFPAAAEPWGNSLDAGQPSWWPEPVLAATYAGDSTLWLLHAFGDESAGVPLELVLSCRDRGGGVHSQRLMLVPGPVAGLLVSGEQPAHLLTIGAHLLAAGLNHLHLHTGQGWRELSLDSGILGLVPTPPLARAGCVVLLENSVALLWLDRLDAVQTVALDFANPLTAFTRAGTLATLCADGGEGRVYDVARRDGSHMAEFAWKGRAAGVVATGERTGFAVVGEEGNVELYVY